MTVRFDDSRPTYLQVADALRAEIRAGTFPPGERLPSVRDLSGRFDIAAVTVQSALRVLRDEGLIASRSTRGYFVSNDPAAAAPRQAPSAEYLALREQLDAVQGAMSDLGDRISRLEEVVQAQAEVDRSGSPQSGPEVDR